MTSGIHDLTPYLGLPYRSGGRTRDGLDCWGLVRLVMAECAGVELPSYTYADAADRAEIGALVTQARPLADMVQVTDRPRPFDLVVIRIGRHPCHIGVCLGDGRMLHILRQTSSTIESLRSLHWVRRIDSYWRPACLAR